MRISSIYWYDVQKDVLEVVWRLIHDQSVINWFSYSLTIGQLFQVYYRTGLSNKDIIVLYKWTHFHAPQMDLY